MSKMGRPKVNNPKEYSLKVWMDKNLKDKLEKYCEKHSITKAEAVRTALDLLLK